MLNFIEDEEVDDQGGAAADEGTCLHKFCEDAIDLNREAYSFIGETRTHNDVTVTMNEELADWMQEGLDFIDQIPGKMICETQVDLSRWLGSDQFGTLDVGLCNVDEIVIFDWKWGYLPVSPIQNYQLMLYALGFYYQHARHYTKSTTFRLVIWQPRAPNGGGEWIVTLDELLEFGRFIKRRAEMTRDPNAKRTPGKIQCTYCPGAKTLTCAEYGEYNLAMVTDDFDRMDEDIEMGVPPRMPHPRGVTPERRAYMIEHKAMFIKFIERLEADELDDFLKGLPTPGRKAVHGNRGKRVWVDEKAAEARLTRSLGEDAHIKKLLSPTQAEKELSPTIYAKLVEDDLIIRGDRQPIMVSEYDARDPVPTVLDLFPDD